MQAQNSIDAATFTGLKDQVGADFVIELIDAYNAETGQLIERLRQALSDQDATAFGRLAHSIKSSSASLGALAFSQQARELEMLAKANDLSDVEPKVEQLASDFVLVKRRLEELKNEP